MSTTTDAKSELRVADPERERVERALGRLRGVADLMDDAFEIPIVRYKIGLDPLIGLIPGGGDWVSWVVSSYILLEAARLGVPARKIARMAWHITVDLIAGYVPGVGDVFDAVYKANRRNVETILDHFDASVDKAAPGVVHLPSDALEKKREGSSAARWLVAIAVVVVSLGFAALPFVVIWWLLSGGG